MLRPTKLYVLNSEYVLISDMRLITRKYDIFICLLFGPTVPTCFFNIFKCFLYSFVLFFRAELKQAYQAIVRVAAELNAC